MLANSSFNGSSSIHSENIGWIPILFNTLLQNATHIIVNHCEYN